MSPKAVPHVEAMAAFALADLGGAMLPTLAQNESAYPPSPRAVAAGEAAARQSHLYPDPDWSDLRRALARAYGVSASGILCGAGSMDLIAATFAAFAGPGEEVLGTHYAYNFAAAASQRTGAAYARAAERGFTVSVDSLLSAVTPATRVVFVCNPGNPTGTRIPNADLVRLRNGLRPDILLVIDQAYGEFDDEEPRAVFDLAGRGDTVVLRTLSKAYGLAGARVGWGLFPPGIAAEVRKMQNSNGVTGVGLAMAVAAVEDQAYMRDVVRRTAATRDRFSDGLAALGYDVPRSVTNFVLVPFEDAAAAREAERRLRAAGLIVRSLAGYGLADCLRIGIGPESAMEKVLDVLATCRAGVRPVEIEEG